MTLGIDDQCYHLVKHSYAIASFGWQGCERDLLSRDRDETRDPCLRDRDVQNFVRDETLQLPRRWPRP